MLQAILLDSPRKWHSRRVTIPKCEKNQVSTVQRNAIRRQRDPTATRSDGELLQVLTASIAVERADRYTETSADSTLLTLVCTRSPLVMRKKPRKSRSHRDFAAHRWRSTANWPVINEIRSRDRAIGAFWRGKISFESARNVFTWRLNYNMHYNVTGFTERLTWQKNLLQFFNYFLCLNTIYFLLIILNYRATSSSFNIDRETFIIIRVPWKLFSNAFVVQIFTC